jgi:hypothetical protein
MRLGTLDRAGKHGNVKQRWYSCIISSKGRASGRRQYPPPGIYFVEIFDIYSGQPCVAIKGGGRLESSILAHKPFGDKLKVKYWLDQILQDVLPFSERDPNMKTKKPV